VDIGCALAPAGRWLRASTRSPKYQIARPGPGKHMALTRAGDFVATDFRASIERIIGRGTERRRDAPGSKTFSRTCAARCAGEGEDDVWDLNMAAAAWSISFHRAISPARSHKPIAAKSRDSRRQHAACARQRRPARRAAAIGRGNPAFGDTLYHDSPQILRLCVSDRFKSGNRWGRSPARAGAAGDAPDFSSLEARVQEPDRGAPGV